MEASGTRLRYTTVCVELAVASLLLIHLLFIQSIAMSLNAVTHRPYGHSFRKLRLLHDKTSTIYCILYCGRDHHHFAKGVRLKSPVRLLALGLEIPEDTFVNMHNFAAVGETYGALPLFRFYTLF
jgi:hypothetical protein